jgi:hypothetical protein
LSHFSSLQLRILELPIGGILPSASALWETYWSTVANFRPCVEGQVGTREIFCLQGTEKKPQETKNNLDPASKSSHLKKKN